MHKSRCGFIAAFILCNLRLLLGDVWHFEEGPFFAQVWATLPPPWRERNCPRRRHSSKSCFPPSPAKAPSCFESNSALYSERSGCWPSAFPFAGLPGRSNCFPENAPSKWCFSSALFRADLQRRGKWPLGAPGRHKRVDVPQNWTRGVSRCHVQTSPRQNLAK